MACRSQFLSGLMLAAPYADDALAVQIDGDKVSQPVHHDDRCGR